MSPYYIVGTGLKSEGTARASLKKFCESKEKLWEGCESGHHVS